MFPSIYAALTAMVIMLFSRAMLVAGSQALIVTVYESTSLDLCPLCLRLVFRRSVFPLDTSDR